MWCHTDWCSLVQSGATQGESVNETSEKASERFTVACKPKIKSLLIAVVADRNRKSGIQINQNTLIQEILEEWLVTRGYLRRDKESN